MTFTNLIRPTFHRRFLLPLLSPAMTSLLLVRARGSRASTRRRSGVSFASSMKWGNAVPRSFSWRTSPDFSPRMTARISTKHCSPSMISATPWMPSSLMPHASSLIAANAFSLSANAMPPRESQKPRVCCKASYARRHLPTLSSGTRTFSGTCARYHLCLGTRLGLPTSLKTFLRTPPLGGAESAAITCSTR